MGKFATVATAIALIIVVLLLMSLASGVPITELFDAR